MKHWCSRKKLIILVTLQILLSPWYGDDRQSSTDEFCPSPPLNKWNSPVWILRWVQQVDAAPLMDINVSPTACFAKEGYRHICGLKLAKTIIEEGFYKRLHPCPILHEIMPVNEKGPWCQSLHCLRKNGPFSFLRIQFPHRQPLWSQVVVFELSSLFMKRQSMWRWSRIV